MNTTSKYDKKPTIKIEKYRDQCIVGFENILNEFRKFINYNDYILVIDTYPGVYDDCFLKEIEKLNPAFVVDMESLFKAPDVINGQLKYNLTEDRVFGRMYFGEILDFIDLEKLNAAKEKIRNEKGLRVVYGFGAALVSPGDKLVYVDLSRWEIQLRYKRGMGNYHCDNAGDEQLSKFKRGYFVEWRIADKHKNNLFDKLDYLIDANKELEPKMIKGDVFRDSIKQVCGQPFRTVPYFVSGVWGGQWMKNVCGLDLKESNYAWNFDGVPEENSLLFDYGNAIVEVPAMDAVLYQPVKLLGKKVYSRFGAEWPIRFDYLDTIEGDNLSLQVHPLTEYIKKEFGMTYTQDESYYIMDTAGDGTVYLGLKEDIDSEEMIQALEEAQTKGVTFDADKYINKFPAKKHDHFLIPAGTCHCSGKNAAVLEISATPYIFTFKLWDWGRVDLDGKPRPIHIEHGKKVIQWDRTTEWVKDNLVNSICKLEENEDYIEERTGLHELEFIETRRYWIDRDVKIETDHTLNMLNLVEGNEAVIESPTDSFDPFTVHYAETFIIPASVDEYIIKNPDKGARIGVIRAYVR